jgi:nucleoside transporter
MMKQSTRFALSGLMFLQYFIWGSWYVTLGTYLINTLRSDAVQVGYAYANLSIAAIISPFFVGMIADRFFSAQKVLGVLHLTGALTLYYIATISDYKTFWWVILLYMILYMPTIALANSISFRQMNDTSKQFPAVRVFGTVGWIVAGLIIGFLRIEASAITFYISAVASLILGIYSFLLPDTPPVKQKTNMSSVLGLNAIVLFKKRSFSLFFIASILICIPLAFYYSFTNPFLHNIGVVNSAGIMTLGQFSEFGFMLLIPLLLTRLGIKKMLLIGMAAWVLRYFLFAYGDAGINMWMLYAGIILHGICYDFFFVTGQIYTDKTAGTSIKNAAQGLITIATYGVGMLIGSYVSGFVTERYAATGNGGNSYNWQAVWMFPAIIAAAVLILFALFFTEKKSFTKTDPAVPTPKLVDNIYS